MRIPSQIGAAIAIPIEIAVMLLGGLWLGNYLDHRFGLSPWLTLAFGALGLVGAIGIVRRISRMGSDASDDESPSKTAKHDPNDSGGP